MIGRMENNIPEGAGKFWEEKKLYKSVSYYFSSFIFYLFISYFGKLFHDDIG
jgi:hypothetical protein